MQRSGSFRRYRVDHHSNVLEHFCTSWDLKRWCSQLEESWHCLETSAAGRRMPNGILLEKDFPTKEYERKCITRTKMSKS